MASGRYVLLPGGAGYIGSHTVVELLQANEFIPVVVDNFYNSCEEALKRIEKITSKKVSDWLESANEPEERISTELPSYWEQRSATLRMVMVRPSFQA